MLDQNSVSEITVSNVIRLAKLNARIDKLSAELEWVAMRLTASQPPKANKTKVVHLKLVN